jgi:hypothetical protein
MKNQIRATSIWREIKPFAMRDLAGLFHRSKSSLPDPITEHALGSHTDTNIPSPDHGDVVTYDSGNAEWIAAPPEIGTGGGGLSFFFVPAVGGTMSAGDNVDALNRLVFGGGPYGGGGSIEFLQNGVSFVDGVPIAFGVFTAPRNLTTMKVTPLGRLNSSGTTPYIYSEAYAMSVYAQTLDAVHYAYADITLATGTFDKFLLGMQMTFPNESSTTGVVAGDTFMIYMESGDNANFFLRGWLVECID